MQGKLTEAGFEQLNAKGGGPLVADEVEIVNGAGVMEVHLRAGGKRVFSFPLRTVVPTDVVAVSGVRIEMDVTLT